MMLNIYILIGVIGLLVYIIIVQDGMINDLADKEIQKSIFSNKREYLVTRMNITEMVTIHENKMHHMNIKENRLKKDLFECENELIAYTMVFYGVEKEMKKRFNITRLHFE
jgi:predicted membrane protein